ncbi:hypothetical protein PsunGV_gp059 [Pseudalatia unipuncta granulovirus]|uniref:Uncharacterized protein n=1 Tax=Pseudalatia unipuncta granulosis virus TaxID=36355 RepID=B6S6S8_GVPU|nr:hypothetical protein PsunGV_gp059 [Pseudalatia unipuncta granulovirus]ACH69409.1 unknown [Pseudalatia unipuncta granulovirus]
MTTTSTTKIYNPFSLYYMAMGKVNKNLTNLLPRSIAEDLQNLPPQHLPGWYIYTFDSGKSIMVVCEKEQDFEVNKQIVQLYKSRHEADDVIEDFSDLMYGFDNDPLDVLELYNQEGKECEHYNLDVMHFCLLYLEELSLDYVSYTKPSSGIFTFDKNNIDDDFVSRIVPIDLKHCLYH